MYLPNQHHTEEVNQRRRCGRFRKRTLGLYRPSASGRGHLRYFLKGISLVLGGPPAPLPSREWTPPARCRRRLLWESPLLPWNRRNRPGSGPFPGSHRFGRWCSHLEEKDAVLFTRALVFLFSINFLWKKKQKKLKYLIIIVTQKTFVSKNLKKIKCINSFYRNVHNLL